MTKSELIDRITETMRIRYDRCMSKVDVVSFLDSLTDVVTERVAAGDDVPLPGLGKFFVKEKAARTGRNPATGESIQIPAKRIPNFTPVKALKDAVA